MKKYDFFVVGSGLFGATFAYLAHKQGKKCLVIDKRPHLGGNVYCENIEGINVHKYGAHIFHTNNKGVANSKIVIPKSVIQVQPNNAKCSNKFKTLYNNYICNISYKISLLSYDSIKSNLLTK